MLWLFCFNVNFVQSQNKLYHSADLCTFILDNSCLVQFMRYMHVPAEQWAMTNFTAYFFFLQINLHIMRRMLSTTFIPCIHGKIRFLRSKKTRKEKESKTTVRNRFLESNPIDSRTRNRYRTRFPKKSKSSSLTVWFPVGTLGLPGVLFALAVAWWHIPNSVDSGVESNPSFKSFCAN